MRFVLLFVVHYLHRLVELRLIDEFYGIPAEMSLLFTVSVQYF